MSKAKEKALAKKLEKAQFAEIDRRYNQELVQKETLTNARLKEEARIAYETEQAWLKAERERLASEAESLRPFLARRDEELSRIAAVDLAAVDWNLYLDTSGLPHASSEASINNYLDVGYSTLDLDFETTLISLLNIYKVANEAEELALQEDQKENFKLAAQYRGYMQKLEALANTRLDQTTNYLLQRSYDIWRDYETNIVTGKVGDWKLALWINHSKNPRFRLLEFPELDISVTLPKSFALANVAVRFLHQTINPLYRAKNSYMPLGGVFVIDVLGLPSQTKIVKSWTLENPTLAASLTNLGYPIPAVGQAAPSAAALQHIIPFGVEITLPSFIIHWRPTPEIGWWDAESQTWDTNGVTDIVYTHDTHKVIFQTTKAKPHAVIQSRVAQVPFKSWNIRPLSDRTGLLTLETMALHVEIRIGSGWCQLLEPKIAECADIQSLQLPPKVLLQQLARRGLNLMPEDDDAPFIKATIKDSALEKIVCRDMALAVPAFTIASSSPWNNQNGRDVCVVRIQEIPDTECPPTLEKSKVVKSMVYKLKGCNLLDYSDKNADYPDRLTAIVEDKLAVYHAGILITLQGNCLPTSQQKMDSGNVSFTECVNALAYALRLFSFST